MKLTKTERRALKTAVGATVFAARKRTNEAVPLL